MSETKTFTNRELAKFYRALAILGNRRMANLGADLKVARLLRALAPFVETLDGVKRQAALGLMPEGAELSPLQEQVLAMKMAEAQAVVDDASVEVDVPMAYILREVDLPKELAGKDGAANASALGAIVADLGPLYLLDEDGE